MARPRDETYIVDLCDDVLGQKSIRGHRFDFLVGDITKRGTRARLPVDAFYPSINLVVEYHERQHCEPVPFFDKRMTVSVISRGEQRKKYDLLRETMLPLNGITHVVFTYWEFEHDKAKRLLRTERDREVIQERLQSFLESSLSS